MPPNKPSLSDIIADVPVPGESDQLAREEERSLERARARLENQDLAQDIDLKRLVAWSAIGICGGSITALFILIFMSATFDWINIPGNVQVALIGGVAVEAVGILVIVAKYLFPSHGADEE